MCCRGGEIGQVADGEDELCGVVVAVQRDWRSWLRLVGVGVDVMSESGLRWLMWRLGLCCSVVVLKGGGGGCLSRERERWRGAKW